MNSLLKSFVLISFVAALCACLPSVVATRPPPAKATKGFALTKEDRGCQVDDDCTFFSGGCCGCNQGGTQTAVNKKHKDALASRLASSCAATMCIQMISNDPTCTAEAPICAEGICTVPQ